jgi:hypothetical protein
MEARKDKIFIWNKRQISKITGANRRLAKVAVQCSADSFVVNQSLVLRINICSENRHLRQAPKRCKKPYDESSCKISTFSLRNGLLQKRNNT